MLTVKSQIVFLRWNLVWNCSMFSLVRIQWNCQSKDSWCQKGSYLFMFKLRFAVFALITVVINGQGHEGMCFPKWCDHSNTILNTEPYSSIIFSKMFLMRHYWGVWNPLISFRNAIAITTQKKNQYHFLKLRFGNQNCMACQSIVKVDSVVEVNENSLYIGECVYLLLLE